MGTLVNPIGWRVNANIYWKVNFFSDDYSFSKSVQDYRVHYLVADSILRKLNAIFYLMGHIKFIKHNIFFFSNQSILLVYFRFYIDQYVREKTKRSYRYFRQERILKSYQVKERIKWLKYAIVRMRTLRSLIRKARQELNFIRANFYLITKRLDQIKLRKLLAKKEARFQFLKRTREHLRYRFLSGAYYFSKLEIWDRKSDLVHFLKAQKFGLYKKYFYRSLIKKEMNYRPLFVYKNRRRERARFFLKVIHGYKMSQVWRFNRFIPNFKLRRFISHNRVVKYRHGMRMKLRSVRLLKDKELGGNTQKKKLFSARQCSTAAPARILWRALKQRQFEERLRVAEARRLLKWWQLRQRKQKVRSVWRFSPWLKQSYQREFWRVKLLLYFKIVPFLVALKHFLIEIYVKLPNLTVRNVYFLNSSKATAVNAKVMLEFVERFLRRRRRVTKINKLFYKIMKILRFFKAKFQLKGFKFMLAGRFLRRDRATYVWRTRGAVPLGTKLAKIDFASCAMQMKYSRPIAKLWICKR